MVEGAFSVDGTGVYGGGGVDMSVQAAARLHKVPLDRPRVAGRLLQEVVDGRRFSSVYSHRVKEDHLRAAAFDVLAHARHALCGRVIET